MTKRNLTAVLFLASMISTCAWGMSEIFDRARGRLLMDLRLLVVEAEELAALKDEKMILIDLSVTAPHDANKQTINSKYMVRRAAGMSVRDHLMEIEQELDQKVFGMHELHVATEEKIMASRGPVDRKFMRGYVTQPGDVIILKGLRL